MNKFTWYRYLIQAEGKAVPQQHYTRKVLEIGNTYITRLLCEPERFTVLALMGQFEI